MQQCIELTGTNWSFGLLYPYLDDAAHKAGVEFEFEVEAPADEALQLRQQL